LANKTIEELEEILAVGDSTLSQFNTRLSSSTIKKFNHIMGILQFSNIGRLSKSATLEYIINQQFAIMTQQKAKSNLSIADKIANGDRL
jgi:hypothetical protein